MGKCYPAPMDKVPSIKEFLTLIGKGWGDRVSGRFSVPFTLASLFWAGYAQIADASAISRWSSVLLFVVALFVTSYYVWKKEREKVELYEERDRPKIQVSEPIQLCDPKDAGGKAKLRT